MDFTTTFSLKPPKRVGRHILTKCGFDKVNYLVRDGINKGRINLSEKTKRSYELVLAQNSLSMTTNDVLIWASQQKFEKTRFIDAFTFAAQYPDVQKDGPIIFLQEAPYFWSGYSFYLMLGYTDLGRVVTFVSGGGIWSSRYRFAFLG